MKSPDGSEFNLGNAETMSDILVVNPSPGSTHSGTDSATTTIAGFELVIDSTETGSIVTTSTTLLPAATATSQP